MATSFPPEAYNVGWICAIPTERTAAEAMLDKTHRPLKSLPKHDENIYTLGSIGAHNVVIACLPSYGTNNAAITGKSMQNTFPNLRFGLMVGVGAGIPSKENDIRLGDVAVSTPTGQNGGVIQYNVEKEEGGFRCTDYLNSPPTLLLNAMNTLRARRGMEKEITKIVNAVFQDDEDEEDEWTFPSTAKDRLFETNSDGKDREIEREPRNNKNPKFFYGTIGSGNLVIKSAKERQLLASREGLICFEMEAAGLMNFFRCIVIRGICDYADKHKNKAWQPYAAAVAAAYAKLLLSVISPEAVAKLDPIRKNQHWMVPRPINPSFTGRTDILQKLREKLCPSDDEKTNDFQKIFVICAMGGVGKSEVCLRFANENRESFWGIFWIHASDEDSIKRDIVRAAKRGGGVELTYDDAKLWFENQEKSWLLIYDNADNENVDYARFFPSGIHGTILMSTRLTECQKYNTVGTQDNDFEKLGFDDSLELLRKTSQVSPEKWRAATEIAEMLIGFDYLCQHALAITQAGAFINQELCSLEEYPTMFKNQRKQLLNYRSTQAQSEYGDVYATFEISAQAMKQSKRQDWADALELLQVLAYLHREGVGENIFTKAWGTAMETIDKDPQEDIRFCSLWQVNQMRRLLRQTNASPRELDILALRRARNALKSFSLITVHKETKDISMHPLVHAWAKDRLEADAKSAAWATTASILALSLENTFEYREGLHKMQPHIEICIGARPQKLFEDSTHPRFEIDRILFALAWVPFYTRNDHSMEAICSTLSTRIGHEILPQSRNWREILYLQALYWDNAARYQDVISLIQQVVSYDKDHLAPDDVWASCARDMLGRTHAELGEFRQAIELLEEVLQTQQKLLKPTHNDVFLSQHDLAHVYLQNQQLDKALPLLIEVARVREWLLPPTHPSRLVSQQVLGSAYLPDNKFEKAIEVLENVVQIRSSLLRATDRNLLGSHQVLAHAYYRNGDCEKALYIINEVVKICSRISKPEDEFWIASEALLSNCRATMRERGLDCEETDDGGVSNDSELDHDERLSELVQKFTPSDVASVARKRSYSEALSNTGPPKTAGAWPLEKRRDFGHG